MNNIPIHGLLFDELSDCVVKIGLPKFRARQIQKAVFDNRICDVEEITTLPLQLREKLKDVFRMRPLKPISLKESADGTRKQLVEFFDGERAEIVLIPELRSDEARQTLCISTQAGCAFDCAFCATGKLNFKRNLSPDEIVGQYLCAEKSFGVKVTNIVFMGMGEPLLNCDNVVKAVSVILENAMIGRRRITVSTSGVVPGIDKLRDEYPRVKLAISLHATTDELRRKMIPAASKWTLHDLLESAERYYSASDLPITYEYILFDGLNDSHDDVARLARICRRAPSKVNLLEYHDISFTKPQGFAESLKPAPAERINSFADDLRALGVNVFVRSSSGKDIGAACGQLAFKE